MRKRLNVLGYDHEHKFEQGIRDSCKSVQYIKISTSHPEYSEYVSITSLLKIDVSRELHVAYFKSFQGVHKNNLEFCKRDID